MPKKRDPIAAVSPWQAKARAEIVAGQTLISLLVDENGAKLIAEGVLPDYVVQQAVSALEWCCTDERTGYVKAMAK